MSKPKKLGQAQNVAFSQLRKNGRKINRAQYKAIKGQIINGKPDDAMRGLQRLLEGKK